jgi:Uncharacterized conserved protein
LLLKYGKPTFAAHHTRSKYLSRKTCIRGLRYPVEFILELLSSGMNAKEIIDDYDDLENEDILAALLFAARLTQVKSIYRVLV